MEPRRLAGHSILLAEDNAVSRQVALRILEKQGHAVTLRRGWTGSAGSLEQRAFDLVLMDVEMPNMNGLQASAAIRAREKVTGRHIPIIAMTAHVMKGDQQKCLAAGMDGYVSKPIRPADLAGAISRTLAS